VWPAGSRGVVRTPGTDSRPAPAPSLTLDETDATVSARRPPSTCCRSARPRLGALGARRVVGDRAPASRGRDDARARPLRRGHGPPGGRPSERLDGMGSRIEQIAERLEAANVRVKAVGTHPTPASARCRVPSRTASTRSTAASTRDLTQRVRPVLRDSSTTQNAASPSSSTVRWADFGRGHARWAGEPERVGARPGGRKAARKVTRTRTDFVPVDQVYEPEFVLVGEPVVQRGASAGYPYATQPERAPRTARRAGTARSSRRSRSRRHRSRPVPVVAPVVEPVVAAPEPAPPSNRRRLGPGRAARQPAKAAGGPACEVR